MTETEARLRHLREEIRLLLARDQLEGLRRWSVIFSELRQAGRYDLCEQLLDMVKSVRLENYGKGIVRYSEGWLYDRKGDWEEAIAAYRSALDLFGQAGLPLTVEIWTQIGSLYQDQGDWTAAEDAYGKAMSAAEQRTDSHGRAMVLHNLGGLWLLRDDRQRAQRYFEAARDEFASCGDRYNEAAAIVGLADMLRDEGRLQDAVDMTTKALMIFKDLRDTKGMASAVASLALIYHIAGRLAESVHNYRAALEMFTTVNDQAGVAKTLANLALVIQETGNPDAAVGLLEQAIAEYLTIGDHHGEALARINLARLHKSRGDTDAMASAAAAAADLCREHGYEDQLLRLRNQVLDGA